MIERDTFTGRLRKVTQTLEAVSAGQRFNFTSLLTKRSIMPGQYDHALTTATVDTLLKVTATPASGRLALLNLEIRYRVGNPDVLTSPEYDTVNRFLVASPVPPTSDGVYVVNLRYATNVVPQTVYFKVIATGTDDFTITMGPY